jgi:deoxyhypusine synthase
MNDWENLGGPNSIIPFSARRSIGIYAPSLIQEQIGEMLDPAKI